MKQSRIHIGTSGWSYEHWQGPFYPRDLAADQRLAYYARHFHSVEINSSFYHLPSPAALRHWYEATPDGFLFSVKASRYITHMKKLREPHKTLPPLLQRIRLLEDKLGPILLQLPPRWHYDAERLADFLAALDKRYRYAFEFRDHSWLNARCSELLARHNAALCIYDLEGYQSSQELTADFVYLRLHGPGAAYQGSYSTQALSRRARDLADWAARGHEVFCYFDNDQQGYAVKDAARLQKLCGD